MDEIIGASEKHQWAEIYIFETCRNEKHEILHASIRKDEQQVIRKTMRFHCDCEDSIRTLDGEKSI